MADREDFDDAGADGGPNAADALLHAAEADIEAGAGVPAGGAGGSSGCTPNPSIASLVRALRNERAAPELLPHETDLVMGLTAHLLQQRAALDATPKSALAASTAVAALYELDVSRMRYMLAEYHRLRLSKIHRWATHLALSDDAAARLSPEERTLLGALVAAREAHLGDLLLSQMPPGMGGGGEGLDADTQARLAEGPNTGVHVYAVINEELGTIPAGDETANLSEGQRVAVLYRTVAPYVMQGKVDLG